MKKFKILDTYCKAGGAGMGYFRAGFEVTGIDVEPQPNYPFEFIQADAVEYIKKHGHKYDAIHASPPCQKYSVSTSYLKKQGKQYPDLIQPTREAINKIKKPGIIENVSNAPIRPDIILYGHMFGLKVIRKRKFEIINWFCLQLADNKKMGTVSDGDLVSIYGKAGIKKSGKQRAAQPKFKLDTIRETWAFAMGIDWYMKDVELSEAIPPAYTEYIGKQLYQYLLKQQ